MNALVFDCSMGIAGDMTVGALIDAGVPFAHLDREIKKLKLKGYKLTARNVRSGAFRSKKFSVRLQKNLKPHHTSLREIDSRIESSKLSTFVKKKSRAIFKNLGRVEAKVHGKPLQKVHFHEVGAIDSIIDIVGTAIGLDYLKIDKAYVRTLKIGRGVQKGSHGEMPVPVPATYELLKGFPLIQTKDFQEKITPTGAAILSTLCEKRATIPKLSFNTIGYGAGDRFYRGRRGFLRLAVGRSSS